MPVAQFASQLGRSRARNAPTAVSLVSFRSLVVSSTTNQSLDASPLTAARKHRLLAMPSADQRLT